MQILIEGQAGGLPTQADAYHWAYELDFDGTGPYTPPIGITVIADVDRGLWNLYNECSVTPQMWIIDEGGVLIDDACTGDPGSLECLFLAPCGEQKQRSRDVLESILPPKWCGEAQE